VEDRVTAGRVDQTSPVPELARALAAEEERLLTCVHCGFCLPACPTYRRLGDEADSPRGRLHLMRAVAEGRLAPDADAFQVHIDRCLGCRACEPVCPSGVPYGHLLERAREVAVRHRPPPLLVRALLAVLAHGPIARVVLGAGRVTRRLGLARLASRLLPRRWALPAAMLAGSAPCDLSRFGRDDAGTRMESGVVPPGDPASGASETSAKAPDGAQRANVTVLQGCVQRDLFARVNRDTVTTLEANGYRVVETAGQGCCGALHAHAGDLDTARSLARANVAAFSNAGAQHVCVNAAGCGAVMREYGELLAGDPLEAAAHEVAAGVRDATELLALAGPRTGAPVRVDVAYDPPCHLLHAQGIADAPLKVLDAVPGLVRRDVDQAAECCGGAGVYGMTHPELGGRIGGDKIEALEASGASLVVTANPGCHMQIAAGMLLSGRRIPVAHVVEVLAESYRRAALPSAAATVATEGGQE
jgi:glycolate oxidase iron-sulfur subunit